MAKVALYNMEGTKTGDMEVSDAIFAAEVNKSVLHQVVVNYLANQRQGTQSTKTRTEVRGGGIKPWRQKGTGRARQGSIRAPQWRGGGTVFGPTPRSYAYTMPRKQRRLAIKSVLSQKLIDNDLIVLDKLTMSAPKTKELVSMLNSLNADGKVLIVTDDNNVQLSARNLAKVKAVPVNGLNVEDAVNYGKLILSQDAVKKIEEVLA